MNRLLLLSALGLTAAGAAAQQTERPNVIFLVADDLGYGDLSCYGAQRVQTPAVDSVAQAGIRFTDAHAVASTSTPSRYSLLTGEYSFRRPDTGVAAGNAALIIRPDQYTLADAFRAQGYATAALGKWHLGLGAQTGKQDWNGEIAPGPADLGFDYSYIMAATADRVPCVYIENGRVANLDPAAPIEVSYRQNFPGEPTGRENPELLTKLRPSHGHDQSIVNGISRIGYMKGGGRALWQDESIADSIMSHAVAFMEREAGKRPFFMYLCTNDVHVPRYPADRFRGKSPMGLRGDAILQFDWTVGRITEALRRLGIAENTLLVIDSISGNETSLILASSSHVSLPYVGIASLSTSSGTPSLLASAAVYPMNAPFSLSLNTMSNRPLGTPTNEYEPSSFNGIDATEPSTSSIGEPNSSTICTVTSMNGFSPSSRILFEFSSMNTSPLTLRSTTYAVS